MKVRYALFCDHSNDTADGKLNLIGITDTLFAYSFPARHREGHFVVSFVVDPADSGTKSQVELRMIDADGKPILSSKSEIQWPNDVRILNQRHILHDIALANAGSYRFEVLVEGEVLANCQLEAQRIEKAN